MNQSHTLADTKSLLAKLMAMENLSVAHLPVSTASFDLKNRVLRCPIWKDMDGEMYDLMMGHEVSHALNTPPQGWHDAVEPRGMAFKGFLNVIEDARIEKMIRRRYPGLKKSFLVAYKALYERGFFGKINQLKNLDHLNLIDRINIHCKMSPNLLVNFNNDQERDFVKRTENVETWEEVVQIAVEVYEYVKENESHKPQTQQNLDDLISKQESGESGEPQEQQGESGQSDKDQKSQKNKDKKGDKKSQDNKKDKSDKNSKDKDKSKSKKDDKGDDADESGSDDGGDSGEKSEDHSDDSKSGKDDDKKEDGDDKADGSGGGEDQDGDGDDEGESDSADSDDGEDDAEDTDEKTPGGNRAGSGSKGDPNDMEDEEPRSLTDAAFRANESSLVDHSALPKISFKLPKIMPENVIVPLEDILLMFENGIKKSMAKYLADRQNSNSNLNYYGPKTMANPAAFNYQTVSQKLVAKFLKRNKNYIAMLVKEFEMRKNAVHNSRQLESRSGELDMRKLHRYRYTNEIFKKITTVEKGKDHGMIMFVDMSGSMEGIFRETIEQVMVLVTFCKKVGIPFDVYGFSNHIPGTEYKKFKFGRPLCAPTGGENYVKNGNQGFYSEYTRTYCSAFHLKTLISSQASTMNQKRAFNMLATVAETMHRSNRDQESLALLEHFTMSNKRCGFELGGTPTVEMLLASKEIIKRFKMNTHCDIVNVMHLTDGVGDENLQYVVCGISPQDLQGQYSKVLIDQETGVSVEVDDKNAPFGTQAQIALTELVRRATRCRHIGFYVGDAGSVRQMAASYVPVNERSKMDRKLKDDGFIKIPAHGYDAYFFLPMTPRNPEMEYRGDFNPDSKDDKQKLTEAFMTLQQEKSNKRQICLEFCKDIAVRL